ncbi:S8 family serine peptidase [Microbacteriaceae bacterium VKM Ac-2854]|nr:S8 family serine peptidase [Microbacteriaceae bacterium VKM Ac-2854]
MTSRTRPPADTPRVEVTAGRPRPYLIADSGALAPAGFLPLNPGDLLAALGADTAVTVQRTIVPSSVAVAANTPVPLQQVIVASMADAKADTLRTLPQVLLEEDELLRPALNVGPPLADGADPSIYSPFGLSLGWTIRAVGPVGEPVVGATVYLYGSGVPAQGVTDANGSVTVSLLNETDDSIRALYVNPREGYWGFWADRPTITSGAVNTVTLTALSDRLRGFPQRQLIGWGQQAMRMAELPPSFTGAGVQVAVIDSGAAVATHPDLGGISRGSDVTVAPANPNDWRVDTIAHGSHTTGVIAAANGADGIRGFAPDATVHELRVFPGGRASNLLDALDYCIDNAVDVVNMSLGGGGTNQFVLQKIAQAKAAGIAMIVAAGNTSGPVSFPGTSPDVLTVAAIGKTGEFPDTSYHAKQVWQQTVTDAGYFAAAFSCHGPEVDVCAPGVAVVSSVPDTGYAAWDGTSMAAPHVAGLAALVLAHHPDFQGPFAARDGRRVDRLFEILKASATPIDVGDPERTGVGMPDARRALAVEVPAHPSTPVSAGAAGVAPAPSPGSLAATLAQLQAFLHPSV